MTPAGDDETYLVAYDGGARARTALQRAAAFAEQGDARLVVVSVLPTDASLAETYDLAEDGTYDPGAAADRLRAAVEDVAPGAAFRAERVDAYAGKGRIASEICRVARETDADVVFLGSDDPGRVVRPVARVDGAEKDDADGPDAEVTDWDRAADYDVFVVRSA